MKFFFPFFEYLDEFDGWTDTEMRIIQEGMNGERMSHGPSNDVLVMFRTFETRNRLDVDGASLVDSTSVTEMFGRRSKKEHGKPVRCICSIATAVSMKHMESTQRRKVVVDQNSWIAVLELNNLLEWAPWSGGTLDLYGLGGLMDGERKGFITGRKRGQGIYTILLRAFIVLRDTHAHL